MQWLDNTVLQKTDVTIFDKIHSLAFEAFVVEVIKSKMFFWPSILLLNKVPKNSKFFNGSQPPSGYG
jgi:hypothetical protein